MLSGDPHALSSEMSIIRMNQVRLGVVTLCNGIMTTMVVGLKGFLDAITAGLGVAENHGMDEAK
jgi:hypothetical protein